MKALGRLLAGVLALGSLSMGWGQQAAPRAFYGRRLEPKESVVLHGAGQSDGTAFAGYTMAMAPSKPMLSMSYVDLRDDLPAYFARLHTELAQYPELIVPQIGLSMNAGEAQKHDEGAVGRGDEDWRLEGLCKGLRSLGRPVLLRVGYEFNGSWNGYEARAYVAAFRRVARAIRTAGLEAVALVWDWSVDAELDAERGGAEPGEARKRYEAFYPGDDVVDWWGINLFTEESLGAAATKEFLEQAEKHRFPVMVGESAPRGNPVSEGQRAVDEWFAPYFRLIREAAGIKAFCYIDWDWRAYPQWAAWGDSKVEDDAAVLRFYRKQVGSALYAGARSKAETMRLLRVR